MIKLQYFIGIQPPRDYAEKIVHLQKLWKNNRLPEVVEPHVTVKAQSGLSADLAWVPSIKEVCQQTSPFKITLGEPAYYAQDVLYLRVESPQLTNLHLRLVEAISPPEELIKRYFERENYSPHLTIGQTYWGMSYEELQEMEQKAKDVLAPFPTFEVQHVQIYEEYETNKYRKFLEIPLAT
ncbi:2'-5' RNA ligase family protein [Falsibacillus pallidus]|uniref:2'-5' RNA ligase n=1 Tax=Falsibacillus pallidus TaxID=493781 RepID=A0A370GQA5_9BACI|nr:2'-5' RNA ligase family protein [Falsibacillus pallidus]RDI45691.1 2'-5' RNA ligase [Falsibacillus pallidus]